MTAALVALSAAALALIGLTVFQAHGMHSLFRDLRLAERTAASAEMSRRQLEIDLKGCRSELKALQETIDRQTVSCQQLEQEYDEILDELSALGTRQPESMARLLNRQLDRLRDLSPAAAFTSADRDSAGALRGATVSGVIDTDAGGRKDSV